MKLLPITKEFTQFAVCQRHTAKAEKHTAKCLPCVTHGKQLTAYKRRQSIPLPWVVSQAHDKSFAVRPAGPWQKKVNSMAT